MSGAEDTLSATKEFVKPGFGGCGAIAAVGDGGGRGGGGPLAGGIGAVSLAIVLLLPVLFALMLRSRTPALRRFNNRFHT